MIKSAFYFILKALFFLKIFKYLSWLFAHLKKRHHNLVNKQLLYTYCPISYEGKATWQWNLVSYIDKFQTCFCFFKKSFIWGKSKWSAASFHYISIAQNSVYNKNKLYKTYEYLSRDMLNFYFLSQTLRCVFEYFSVAFADIWNQN